MIPHYIVIVTTSGSHYIVSKSWHWPWWLEFSYCAEIGGYICIFCEKEVVSADISFFVDSLTTIFSQNRFILSYCDQNMKWDTMLGSQCHYKHHNVRKKWLQLQFKQCRYFQWSPNFIVMIFVASVKSIMSSCINSYPHRAPYVFFSGLYYMNFHIVRKFVVTHAYFVKKRWFQLIFLFCWQFNHNIFTK